MGSLTKIDVSLRSFFMNIGVDFCRLLAALGAVFPVFSVLTNLKAKGILHANIGLNPQSNGEMLIITVPPLTEERRKDLVRRVKAESENAKVAVRNHRKEAMDMIKTLKEDGLSEDITKGAEEEIQHPDLLNLHPIQVVV